MRLRLVFIALTLFLCSAAAAAEEIVVAAAADLRFALQEIADQYQRQTGNRVKLSFGSSGSFYSLIENGAPYDVFFSADIAYPQTLERNGRTESGSLYEYAFGKLVLWVPRGSPLDLRQGLRVLLDPRIRRIAIANPAHAPYGRAAVAAMQQAGVYDRVKSKFVMGENISQTAEFVQTGNADVGLLALSLALAPTMKSRGRFVELAPDSYPPIRQGAVILRSSRKKTSARQFLQFFKGPRAGEVLRQYGFAVPRP